MGPPKRKKEKQEKKDTMTMERWGWGQWLRGRPEAGVVGRQGGEDLLFSTLIHGDNECDGVFLTHSPLVW